MGGGETKERERRNSRDECRISHDDFSCCLKVLVCCEVVVISDGDLTLILWGRGMELFIYFSKEDEVLMINNR